MRFTSEGMHEMNYKVTQITFSIAITSLMGSSICYAWNPPDGDTISDATPPGTATTPLTKGHGWLTQAGISILDNDGYWFAAQRLRAQQNNLLSGNRWEDEGEGKQKAELVECLLPLGPLNTCPIIGLRQTLKQWPLSADNHYYNPDTKAGLNVGALVVLQYWAGTIQFLHLIPGAHVFIDISPDLKSSYLSGVDRMKARFDAARSSLSQGQESQAFRMLGAAVHLVQDLNVVHHTFDEFTKHHSEYEDAGDAWISGRALPQSGDGWSGRYLTDAQALDCVSGDIRCLATNAAQDAHIKADLDQADKENYPNVSLHIKAAAEFTAGVLHEFLVQSGENPLNVPAALTSIL